MKKSQFIIIGVLSLIAVIASTSTISAYAQLRGGDVVDLANSVANGETPDVKAIAQQANPLQNPAVKDAANKVSDQVDIAKILGSANKDPREMLSGLDSNLPIGDLPIDNLPIGDLPTSTSALK